MENEAVQVLSERKKRIGWTVFLVLAALTIVEFALALFAAGQTTLLIAVALVKASLIVIYFMHIGRLFSDSEE